MKKNKITLAIIFYLVGFCCSADARVLPFAERPDNYVELIDGINKCFSIYKNEYYVIGHKSADSDTVCSAITFANLKRHLGLNCKAVVTGNLNNETKFVLDYWGIEVPEVLEDATDKNLILVDHNIYGQGVENIRNANIIEIIDHHNLGDVATDRPIIINFLPVGSTATIVYLQYIEQGVRVSRKMAGLMISAILSDTNNLTLATTTQTDKCAIANLAKIAELENIDEYYSKMLEAAISYEGMTDEEIFFSDYKEFEMNGHKVSISSILAKDEKVQQDLCSRLLKVMNNADQAIEHRYAFIIDKNNHKTEIIYFGNGAEEIARKAFKANNEGKFILDFEASRKFDIVPSLSQAYK